MNVYFIQLFLPNFDLSNPPDISKVLPDIKIRFDPERFETGIAYLDNGPREDRPYHYYCLSCYAACGYKDRVFKTSPDAAKRMKDGPTPDQQKEMQEHAEQHTILYQWAKGILKA